MTCDCLARTSLGALLAAGAVVFSSGRAFAQECATDADCPTGFACEVVGASSCPGYACPEGEPCPPPPPCEPQEFRECVPGPCQSDADCAEGLVCFTETKELCSGGSQVDCPPDVVCPPPEPTVCETVTESQCVPPYVPPCAQDSDCGEGFLCVEQQSCGCSGSAPSPDGQPVPEPTCTCTSSGQFYCELQQIACTAATDCPSGWTCEQGGETGVCSRSPDGGTTCETTPPEYFCMPPYFEYLGGVPRGYDEGSVTGGDSSGEGTTQSPSLPPDTTEEPANPGVNTVGTGSESSDGGGCGIARGTNARSGWALGLALVLAPLVRRRARRRQ